MRWSSEFCIVMLLIQLSSVGSVTAADSQPHAGFIEARDGLPCMRAKPRPPDCQLSTVDPFADAKEQTAQRLSRAKFYIGAGDRRHALVEAEEALKLSPQDVDIRHLVGRIAMSIGENDLAEREFRLALQQRPNDPDIEASDATRLLNLSQEGALRSFDSIVEAHPDHRYSRESRAELLMKLGQPDRAMKDLDTLLARDGHDVRLLALRANANIVSGRPQQAIADLTEALKQSTARPDLITLRAMAYEMKGDDNAALKDYEAVLGPIGALQPTYVMRG
jgi:predicted Zn-dependent protease